MTYPLLTSARVAVAPFGVRMPLTCSRHSRHVYACPHIFRFRMRRKLPLHMVRDSCLHAWSRTPSIPSILAAGVVYRARTVKPSHMSPPRGQSLPAATHSEAVSYSCNAALAVGISFLVGCNPKLVCPATLMLFSVGTVPASGGTPTL